MIRFNFKPLNNGHSCPMAPIGPRPVYCPTANSMNNIGTPHTNNIMKYGMRNMPAKMKIHINIIDHFLSLCFCFSPFDMDLLPPPLL